MNLPQFQSRSEITEYYKNYFNMKEEKIKEDCNSHVAGFRMQRDEKIQMLAKDVQRMEKETLQLFIDNKPIKKITKVTWRGKYDRVRSRATRIANVKRGRELKGMGISKIKNGQQVIYDDNTPYCQCYTCEQRNPAIEMECGHYKSRRYYAYRRSVKNTKPQCTYCNKRRNGNVDIYRQKLTTEYGKERVDMMDTAVMAIQRMPPDHELERLYNELRPRVQKKMQEYNLKRQI